MALTSAELTVTDTGPGIPDPDRERIFDRLVRLDLARNRDAGGAGLGLAIARGLARAHHGDLTCEPHQTGAQFRLTLPLAPSPVQPGPDHRQANTSGLTSAKGFACRALPPPRGDEHRTQTNDGT